MGTTFALHVAGSTEAAAGRALEAALDEIARLERVLSEWRPTSEISRINRGAGGPPTPVSWDTWRVVEAGYRVSALSGGAFDLTWAGLVGLYDFRPGHRRVPDLEAVRARLPRVDFRKVAFRPERYRPNVRQSVRHSARQSVRPSVRLAAAKMALGTGGIGKGYALDAAAAVLRRAGLENFMLFGGGQVQTAGTRGDRPWRVGIQHPRDPGHHFAFVEVVDRSLATSGDYERAFVDEAGRHWHHIIDPKTGLPARATMQVTLLADKGLYADALGTACFVAGPARCLAMLEQAPGRPEAVIVGPDLRLYTTPGTRERLTLRVELAGGRLPGQAAFRTNGNHGSGVRPGLGGRLRGGGGR